MRRWMRGLACLTALCLLAGCGGRNGPVRVTLVLKTTVETAEFWEEVMDGVSYAVEEYDVDLTVTGASAETEIEEQIDVMESVIADKPDVILLVASDVDRLAPVTEKAAGAGITVLTMDSDVDTDARTACVASDNTEIGRSLSRQMLELVDGGQIAILSHSLAASSGIERAQGAREVLSENQEIEIVGTYDCQNDVDKAGEITGRLLEEYPELRGFVCTNEVCNRGAAAQLVEQGMAGSIMVVGCDNAQQQISYLEQNAIQAIVIQRPFNMGYEAVKQAARAARGEKIPSFIEIPSVTITRDNMYKSENQKLLFPF